MTVKVDPTIDYALIDACRILMQRYGRASETLVLDDTHLDELVSMVKPQCGWPRDRIKRRVITLRKKPPSPDRRMPRLEEVRGEKNHNPDRQ